MNESYFYGCGNISDSCFRGIDGQYDNEECKQAKKLFREKICIGRSHVVDEKMEKLSPRSGASKGSNEARTSTKNHFMQMKEVKHGEHKTFFCCRKKSDGNDYGFLQTSSVSVQEAELAALSELTRGDGALARSRLVHVHPVHARDESSEWILPDGLITKSGAIVFPSSGYWVELSPTIFVLRPKTQNLGCDSRIIRAIREILDEDQKGVLLEGLEYIKSHLSKICSVLGGVKLLIQVDGRVLLTAVAPGRNGETCKKDANMIAQGIEKCTEQIRNFYYVLPEKG